MDFTELSQVIDRMPGWDIPAADCAVTLRGKQIFRRSVGYAELETGKPITEDTVYYLYSASKVSTCVGVLMLLERGAFGLDDPVSRYLPSLSALTVAPEGEPCRPARTVLTIRHLMTMTGGFTYDLDTPAIRAVRAETAGRFPTRRIADALAAAPLAFDPGTRYRYSLCHDVLGALIDTVSGVSFGTFLQENLFAPLGMKDTTFHPSPSQLERMALQYYGYDHRTGAYARAGKVNPYVLGTEYESGGAGLVSTVNDYLKLGTMMAAGGVAPDGSRLLRRETLELMRTDALSGQPRADFDLLGKRGYSYGLGVRTMVSPESAGAESPRGEYGWDGAMGAYLVIDPDNQLCLFYAQHESGAPWHHEAIRDALYRGLR